MEMWYLALGGLVGSALKAWITASQATFSKKSIGDVLIGGAVGLLWPVLGPIPIPADLAIAQKAALVGVLAYVASDFLQNAITRVSRMVAPKDG